MFAQVYGPLARVTSGTPRMAIYPGAESGTTALKLGDWKEDPDTIALIAARAARGQDDQAIADTLGVRAGRRVVRQEVRALRVEYQIPAGWAAKASANGGH